MPLLLNLSAAPALDRLMAETDTRGLEWSLQGRTSQDAWPAIAGIGSLAGAGESEISFAVSKKYLQALLASQARAVIVTPEIDQACLEAEPAWFDRIRVLCNNPYLLYARLTQWFERARQPVPDASAPAIHATAVVAPTAELGEGVRIGPGCVVEEGAKIGARTVLEAACLIGRDVEIGEDSLLHPRVTLYARVQIGARAILHSGVVLGADGFGFAPDHHQARGGWSKIAQFGRVVLGNDVEVGANTTIDRGALEDTVIGNDVKIDNQIMIGHNCRIGDHTAIAACVGIAGSTTIGQRCTLGGAAMFSGHLTVGDDVHISGGTAVTSDILKPGRYTGVFPYAEHADWQRNAAVLQQLAQIRRRVRSLEQGASSES